MEKLIPITGKVIAFEPDQARGASIQALSEEMGMKGVVLSEEEPFILEISSRLNIGAIVLNAESDGFQSLVVNINAMLPEIPLLIQTPSEDSPDTIVNLSNPLAKIHYFRTGDLEALRALLNLLLYCRQYPPEFINLVIENTQNALMNNLHGVQVVPSRVFVASDKRIFGGRLEMMPFCTPWCEGMMMIQSNGEDIDRLVRAGCTPFPATQGSVSRYTEDVLREIMNQVWGGFKSSFVPPAFVRSTEIEVPMTINHDEKYVSFGATDPLLCFRFSLEDAQTEKPRFPPLIIYLKFSFHLRWNALDFHVNERPDNDSSSEIELF